MIRVLRCRGKLMREFGLLYFRRHKDNKRSIKCVYICVCMYED